MCKSTSLPSDELFRDVLAITNRHLCQAPFLDQLERICQHHPAGIVLREKDLSAADYLVLAKDVLPICTRYDVPCTLHTFTAVALELHCSKLHLPLALLREEAASLAHCSAISVLGTSIHSVAEAREAESLGATYLTAGHIYATDCKKDLAPRGTEFLRSVCDAVDIPVYAIGGIHLDYDQIQLMKDCGATGVCMMSELM